MLLLILLVVVCVIVVAKSLSTYNGFVKTRNLIQESWRQIDVELNRRYELIPNLVETVRGVAAHERNTLEEVTRLRNQAAMMAQEDSGMASEQRARIEQQLSGAVRGLMVSVESYPELRSSVNFLELQRELTDTEDRIAAGRRFYNANVRDYNTRVESIPSNFVAKVAKFEKATYFELTDQAMRQAPGVNFGEISRRPEGGAGAPTVPPGAPMHQAPQLGYGQAGAGQYPPAGYDHQVHNPYPQPAYGQAPAPQYPPTAPGTASYPPPGQGQQPPAANPYPQPGYGQAAPSPYSPAAPAQFAAGQHPSAAQGQAPAANPYQQPNDDQGSTTAMPTPLPDGHQLSGGLDQPEGNNGAGPYDQRG